MGFKLLRVNKQLEYNYDILDKFVAGICLHGDEVRKIKQHKFNIDNAFVIVHENEVFVDKFIINDLNNTRRVKLLLKKKQIDHLISKLKEKKYKGLILDVFVSEKNLIKLTIVIAKLKKKIDKKNDQKRRTEKIEMEKEFKKYFEQYNYS